MPVGGEEGRGAAQEPRAGLAPLVGQDLHVGQPGVVVHSGVDIVIARAAARSGGADPVLGGRPAVDALATAGTQPAELLDIEVEQLAGVGAFVAADDPAGWPVHDGQPVEAQPAKDAVDGGGRPTSGSIHAGPSLRPRRSRAISASTLVGRRLGCVWAVLGQSCRPAGPCCW